MPIEPAVIHRLFLRRLLRYRVAWLSFSLLGYYLAGVFLLVLGARQQVRITGTIHACRPYVSTTSGEQGVTFTLDGNTHQEYALIYSSFTPTVPKSLCKPEARVSFVYETNSLSDPFQVNEITAANAKVYATTTYGVFPDVQRVELVLVPGGMALVSTIMLVVAIFWKQVGPIARKTNRTRPVKSRKLLPIPTEFLRQVDEDLNWLYALPWGEDAEPNHALAYRRFHRGVALVRGWAGNEAQLLSGVHLLLCCTPALAFTGAAEVALQLGAHDLNSFAPHAVEAALDFCARALTLAPGSLDARLTQVHALAAAGSAGDVSALEDADSTLAILREVAADHPRLHAAIAAVYLARRQYQPAIAAQRQALAEAPFQEEAQAMLDLMAQTLLHAGSLKQALRLFVKLNLEPPDMRQSRLTPARRRLATSSVPVR
jgi:hypothetical protein